MPCASTGACRRSPTIRCSPPWRGSGAGTWSRGGCFAHDIPGEGYAPLWLLRQVPRARGAGENLGRSAAPNGAVVRALFAAWVASPAHYENMVRPQFTRVGVGVVEVARPRGPSLKVVAQVFAAASGPLREQPAIFSPPG